MMTYGHVKKPTGAAKKRLIANGRVAVEHPKTGGRVPGASSVANERVKTGGRVAVARVEKERPRANGGIGVAVNVIRQCAPAKTAVVEAIGIVIERKGADSRIVIAG